MHDDTTDPRRGRTRTGRLLAFVGVTLPAMMLAVLAVALFVDDPLLPTADLEPPAPLDLQDRDNAYWHLREAMAVFVPPAFDAGEAALKIEFAFEEPESDPQSGVDWDSIETWVRDNPSALEHLEQAAAAQVYQAPEIFTSDDPVPHVTGIRRLNSLLGLRSLWLMHEGRWRASRDSALMRIRLGRTLGQNPGAERVCLVALAVQLSGLEDLRWLAVHRDVPVELLEETLVLLAEPELVGIDMGLALRRGHRVLRADFDTVMEETLGTRGAGGRLLFFKRHRTLNAMAARFRDSIARVGQPGYPGPLPADEPGLLSALLSSNAVGELCLQVVARSHDALIERAYHAECYRGLTCLAIAVRLHLRRHGRLPDTAAELVPGILPALPRDPFAGAALGYRRSPCLVYSAGSNGLDEGGIGDDPFVNIPNLPETASDDR